MTLILNTLMFSHNLLKFHRFNFQAAQVKATLMLLTRRNDFAFHFHDDEAF